MQFTTIHQPLKNVKEHMITEGVGMGDVYEHNEILDTLDRIHYLLIDEEDEYWDEQAELAVA